MDKEPTSSHTPASPPHSSKNLIIDEDPSNNGIAIDVLKNHDGSTKTLLYDLVSAEGEEDSSIYVTQYLSTHPLRSEIAERPGPGGMKLTYLTGDSAIRNMNLTFGYNGWGTEIRSTTLIQNDHDKDSKRWIVCYCTTLRTTIKNGLYHDDVGFGQGIHKSKMDAYEKAMKCSVTDAMKRCVRHFGERLGNALYKKRHGISIRNAPVDNYSALVALKEREKKLWCGDRKENDLKRRRVEEDRKIHTHSVSPPQEANKCGASNNNNPTSRFNNNAHGVTPPESNKVYPSTDGNIHCQENVATRLNFHNTFNNVATTSSTKSNCNQDMFVAAPTNSNNRMFVSALSLDKIPPINTTNNINSSSSNNFNTNTYNATAAFTTAQRIEYNNTTNINAPLSRTHQFSHTNNEQAREQQRQLLSSSQQSRYPLNKSINSNAQYMNVMHPTHPASLESNGNSSNEMQQPQTPQQRIINRGARNPYL